MYTSCVSGEMLKTEFYQLVILLSEVGLLILKSFFYKIVFVYDMFICFQ